ncbi:hypothetical protein CAEBREN_00090 [Caenorhabditis brenneri]|uniref:Uncharacterized protein n=1 Tax=Caenorhabditis brenneri TaxID=135651 RepID=G0MDK4_CAEBE|nr:hypothetical protein CAEBREN_00090 [Caenorhabditis brenneri]
MPTILEYMKMHMVRNPGAFTAAIRAANNLSTDEQHLEVVVARECDKFFETEEYWSGSIDYAGYVVCCEWLEYCWVSRFWVFIAGLVVVIVISIFVYAYYSIFCSRSQRRTKNSARAFANPTFELNELSN